ncbi:MAG: signal recognition particle subunit SRP19/SEC65 family protein [Candidatus Heimdallarchaeota archaeon]|nr:signal recognition particle subunit SRP19/SEC65 family protein [Candidatus Heimdallarchaeota archaeon]
MLRKSRSFVLYPEYFDKQLSRKEGRKIPRSKAVEDCNLSKIAYACKHLELTHTIQKDKHYSKNWWNSEGRIVVNPEGANNKTELIRRVANVARKLKKVEKLTEPKAKGKPKQTISKT